VTHPLLISLAVSALLLVAGAPLAAAQDAGQRGGGPPTELWDEFPLKQPAPGSGERGGRSAAAAAGSTRPDERGDGASDTLPLLLAGAAVLTGLGLAVAAGVGIRRRRSRTAVTARRGRTLPVGSVKPGRREGVAADGRASPLLAATQAAGREAERAPPPQPAAAPSAEPAPAAKPDAEPAPAAKPAAEPEAPPAPKPEEPAADPGAPGRTEPSHRRPPVVPLPAAAKAQDGAATSGAQPATRPSVATQRAVGYASVSAADDLNNAELKVQVRLIQEACQRRGLTLVKIVRDVESHASSDLRRPGLTYALDRLAARDASCLVVASLERLTRTAANLGALLGWLTECDARLVVIDLDLDTGTEEGQLGARALATVGGLERRKLEERTRKGLEAAREMRRSGRPAVSDRPSLKQRIADMRAQGMTLQAIADTLNSEGVPTLRGGTEWRPSSVQAAAGYKRPRRKSVLRSPAPQGKKRA
jgi:DNA invertase Pin-like site-specific DNA recombinase